MFKINDCHLLEKITLPLCPSVNALYGGGSKQKRFPSKSYKVWLGNCPVLKSRGHKNIILCYKYFWPDNRQRDTENYVKAVSDYLVKQGVIEDDCWQCVESMHLTHGGIDRLNPRVEITIFKSSFKPELALVA